VRVRARHRRMSGYHKEDSIQRSKSLLLRRWTSRSQTAGRYRRPGKRALRELNLEPKDLLPGSPLDFALVADRLRESTYPGFPAMDSGVRRNAGASGREAGPCGRGAQSSIRDLHSAPVDGRPETRDPVLALRAASGTGRLADRIGYTDSGRPERKRCGSKPFGGRGSAARGFRLCHQDLRTGARRLHRNCMTKSPMI